MLLFAGCGEKYAGEWRDRCVRNLGQLEVAKDQWALEGRKRPDDLPIQSDLVGEGKYIKNMTICPAGGQYTLNIVDKLPECSVPSHKLEK